MPRRARTWLRIADHVTLSTTDTRVGMMVAGGVLVGAAFVVFPSLGELVLSWLEAAKARFLTAMIFQWATLIAVLVGAVFMPPLQPVAGATKGHWRGIALVTLAIAAIYAVAGR